uniref:Uncharacterized protein n=1 Tax=Panagrolaimus sp. ES5 TaxID=591445 RepID=A0AC34GGR2_9BILA
MPDQLPARVRFRDPSVLEHPVDVLKWMKKNANPKMAFKLMKCCKFFQIPEFPYFVVKEVCYDKKKWTFITLDNEKHVFESIENITKKLWITKYLFFKSKNLTSHLISKIGVCNVEMLSLINQVITYDEFQILTASGTVKDFHFFNSM